MKTPALNLETLKFAGGAIVIAAAVLIVMPSILGLAFGVMKIVLTIVAVGAACIMLTLGTRRIMRLASTKSIQGSTPPSQTAISGGNYDDEIQPGA